MSFTIPPFIKPAMVTVAMSLACVHPCDGSEKPPPGSADLITAVRDAYRGEVSTRCLDDLTADLNRAVDGFTSGSADEDPYLRSLRTMSEWSAVTSKKKQRGRKVRRHVVHSAGELSAPITRQVRYVFGSRTLECLDDNNRDLEKAIGRGKAVGGAQLDRTARLEELIAGRLPETELLVANIQRELDSVRTWDEFAMLLDSWRHRTRDGDESFYHALDRTAGTDRALFFYDSMLDDFVERCGDKRLARAGHATQASAIHDAFLSFRRYRAFIEAVSWSLVLPPDEELPAGLERYDYAAVPAGSYSVRHVLDILLQHYDGDAAQVIGFVREMMEGIGTPDSVGDDYEPVIALNASFGAMVPAMVSKSQCSTDALGDRRREAHRRLADAMRAGVQRFAAGP